MGQLTRKRIVIEKTHKEFGPQQIMAWHILFLVEFVLYNMETYFQMHFQGLKSWE